MSKMPKMSWMQFRWVPNDKWYRQDYAFFFLRTYQRTTGQRAWLQSSVPCWRTPWTLSSSTSTPEETVWRCPTWTSPRSWSPCNTRSPSTPRLQMPSSRTLSPRKTVKVCNQDAAIEWNLYHCSCSAGRRKGHYSKKDFGKKGKREKCLFSSTEKWEFELKYPASSAFSDTRL